MWSTRNDADTDNGSCSGSGTGKAPRRQEEFQSQHWLQGVTLAHNLVVTPRRRWCDDDVTRIRVRSYRTAAAAAVQKTPLGGWEWRPTTYARANGRITIADRENGVHPIPDEMHPHDDVQLIDRGTVTGCHRLSQGLSQAVTGAVTGCHTSATTVRTQPTKLPAIAIAQTHETCHPTFSADAPPAPHSVRTRLAACRAIPSAQSASSSSSSPKPSSSSPLSSPSSPSLSSDSPSRRAPRRVRGQTTNAASV